MFEGKDEERSSDKEEILEGKDEESRKKQQQECGGDGDGDDDDSTSLSIDHHHHRFKLNFVWSTKMGSYLSTSKCFVRQRQQ
ncbi:hypothetical protein QYF36_022615 [Acer negundo]|nr:hypothetical protein QYF36_022615 [Acer negundo]